MFFQKLDFFKHEIMSWTYTAKMQLWPRVQSTRLGDEEGSLSED